MVALAEPALVLQPARVKPAFPKSHCSDCGESAVPVGRLDPSIPQQTISSRSPSATPASDPTVIGWLSEPPLFAVETAPIPRAPFTRSAPTVRAATPPSEVNTIGRPPGGGLIHIYIQWNTSTAWNFTCPISCMNRPPIDIVDLAVAIASTVPCANKIRSGTFATVIVVVTDVAAAVLFDTGVPSTETATIHRPASPRPRTGLCQ